jgi:hypothetical protein
VQELIDSHICENAAIVSQNAVAAATKVATAIQHVFCCLLQLLQHTCWLVCTLQHCKLLVLAS